MSSPTVCRLSVVAFLLFVLVTSFALFCKIRLDQKRPPQGYLELLYAPKGTALHLLSFGFRSPLADWLWVRSLIYYSDNMRAILKGGDSRAGHRYLYKLFDVITDLQPRFITAYFYGGLFLFSTGQKEQIQQGLSLFAKALRTYEQARAEGSPIEPDDSWRFHLYAADVWENQLGDREKAREHLLQVVRHPDCPSIIRLAWVGLEASRKRGGNVLEQYDMMIHAWENLLHMMSQERKEQEEFKKEALARLEYLYALRERLRITRRLEEEWNHVIQLFSRKTGRIPHDLQELISVGLIPHIPPSPMDVEIRPKDARSSSPQAFAKTQEGKEPPPSSPDRWILLPTGEVRSEKLAQMETQYRIEILEDAIREYVKRKKKSLPSSFEDLVKEGILEHIPTHPLESLGYKIHYDPKTGDIHALPPPSS